MSQLSTDTITAKVSPESPDADALKQVEIMLDYIRANLDNVRRTWGTASPQFRAASEIMQKYFNENIKKLDVNVDHQQTSLEDLITKMSLDENPLPN